MQYKIGRDDSGLTRMERSLLGQLALGESPTAAAATIGVTRQRVSQLLAQLEAKGRIIRNGRKVIVVKEEVPS